MIDEVKFSEIPLTLLKGMISEKALAKAFSVAFFNTLDGRLIHKEDVLAAFQSGCSAGFESYLTKLKFQPK